MAWETFSNSAPETRIMIRKITIRHVDKHNRPQGQTIYQINQRLSAALQHNVGEQLNAYECAGWTLASQLTPTMVSKPTSKIGVQRIDSTKKFNKLIKKTKLITLSFHSLSPLKVEPIKSGSPSPNLTFPRFNVVTKNLKTPFNANPSTCWSPPLKNPPFPNYPTPFSAALHCPGFKLKST